MKGLVLALALIAMTVSATELEWMDRISSETPYGSQLKDIIALALGQGQKVDQVVGLLEDILKGLQGDQNADDIEHSNRMTQYTQTIEQLEHNLEALNAESVNNNRQIGELAGDVANLAQSVASLTRQLNLINTREESLRNARTDEQSSIDRRRKSNTKVLQAIQDIHDRLVKAVLDHSGQFLELSAKDDLVSQMKQELGPKHPIALLVEVTAKFDEQSARTVIAKLEEIADAIRQSEVEDDNNEQNAQSNFQAIISELTDVRNKLSTDYNQSNNLQKSKKNDLVVAQRRKSELDIDLQTTETLLQQNRTQKEQYDSGYGARRSQRLGELEAVEAAYNLVVEHKEKLRN